MFEIEGTLIEVGTLWCDDTRISIEIESPTGEKQIVHLPCTKEDAARVALRLYQRVTVKVLPVSLDDK